jgi:hypothetical protein
MQTAEQLHQSPDYAELFIQSKRDWANYQGYDYIHNVIETDLTDVPERITANSNTIVPSTIRNSSQQIIPLALIKQSADWLKIDLLRQHLPRYDWVCWLDMDTLVVDMQVELQSFIRQAIRHRPQLDLVIEGSPVEYRNLNGRSLRTGVMIFRNSVWTQRLLAQASDLLSDPEWSQLAGEALTRRSDESSLADALVVLLNDERQFKGSDAHLYFMKLQDWWDQNLLYLPRIGILHFRNCLESDSRCLRVLRAAVEHLLHGEQFYIYQAAPYVQHIYNIFVVIYVFFSIDRLYHIVGRWRKRKPQLKVENYLMI